MERRTIFKNFTGLYILGSSGETITDNLIEFIHTEIRNSNDLFLQIEPSSKVQSTGEIPESMSSNKVQTISPFRRFIEPVTAILNLNGDEEALLASFAEKGRYNIRLAQKRGVTTRWAKGNQTLNVER